MTTPLVSVLIPSYRRADTVATAVRSALDQTHRDLEVIVVDDDSRDGTQEAVRALVAQTGDERVHYVRHDRNRGGNAARRTAVAHSRGTHLAFLDADDRWHPDKLSAQLARLEEVGPGYGLVYTWYDSLLSDGRLLPARRPRAQGLASPALLRENVIGTFSTVLVTREAYERVGGPDPSLPSCQDWEFYLRLNEVTGIAYVPRVLATYWRGEDPQRISADRARVAAGHAQIYRRIASRLRTLSTDDAVAARRYLLEAVAGQGDTAQVLAMARDIPPEQWTPGAVRFVTHMLARSARKGGLRTLAGGRS